MQRTYSVTAHTTPEKAYAYVADLTRHPEWSPDDMKMAAENGGSPAVGTRYRANGKLVGRPNDSTVEIVAMDAPKRLAFKAIDKNSEFLHEFSFTRGDGGTRIDRTVTMVKGPPGSSVLLSLLHPFVVGPGNMRSMNMLRERLEGGAAV